MLSHALLRQGIVGQAIDSLYEWTPAVVRSGHQFAPVAERALDPAVRLLASRLPGRLEGVLATAEFVGPVGIADLVAVTRSKAQLLARLDTGVPPLTSLADASVVAAVPALRATAAIQVASSLGISRAQATRRLRQLVQRGVLFENSEGYRRNSSIVAIGRMYAFEAKVSDWRKGFAQALRYARWADASGIVLLNPPRDLDILASHARTLRLGLAVRNRWLVKPVMQPVSQGLRLFASELFVATVTKADVDELP